MISALTRRAKETASLNVLRRDSKTIRIKAWPWRDVMLRNTSAEYICSNVILSTVVRGTYFAEPDTILVFKIFYEVFGGGTRLAMPKTISAPDSSSLKPGSGATEGVPD